MKYLFISLMLILSANLFAQEPSFAMSGGMSVITENTYESSNIGLSIGFIFQQFYFDASFNNESGTGEYLEYSTDETYRTEKVSWYALNLGYNFYFNDNNTWVTPTLGAGSLRKIYNDPVGFDTYFYGDEEMFACAGVILSQRLVDFVYVSAGINTFEMFKLQLGFILK